MLRTVDRRAAVAASAVGAHVERHERGGKESAACGPDQASHLAHPHNEYILNRFGHVPLSFVTTGVALPEKAGSPLRSAPNLGRFKHRNAP